MLRVGELTRRSLGTGGEVWAPLLFLNHQGLQGAQGIEKRLIVRGGAEYRAVSFAQEKAPGRGRQQGAWADRAVIFERNVFKKVM